MDATFEEVLKLAEQLERDEQDLLIYRLRVKQIKGHEPEIIEPSELWNKSSSPTREELMRQVEILRGTPVRSGDILLGKYANPNAPEMSEEEFHAQMHTIATEWEQELDEFNNDES